MYNQNSIILKNLKMGKFMTEYSDDDYNSKG